MKTEEKTISFKMEEVILYHVNGNVCSYSSLTVYKRKQDKLKAEKYKFSSIFIPKE